MPKKTADPSATPVTAILRSDVEPERRVTMIGDSAALLRQAHKIPELQRLSNKGLKMIQECTIDEKPGLRFVFRRDVNLPCGHYNAARITVLVLQDDCTSKAKMAELVEVDCDAQFAKAECATCKHQRK